MSYRIAKINPDTNEIAEFPILDHFQHPELLTAIKQNPELENLRSNLPSDYVIVEQGDVPSLNWDQAVRTVGVSLVDGVWTTQLEAFDRFTTDEEKIAAAKTYKIAKNSEAEGSFTQLVMAANNNGYSEVERSTFAQQRVEALAYTADNSVSTPLLTAIADARETTVAILAPKVIAKAEENDQVIGNLIGRKRKVADRLEAIDLNDVSTFSNFNNISF
tara:strand:- start:12 stop:665 length:654 start_codon:yes stop_codon:yes gene_type:complete